MATSNLEGGWKYDDRGYWIDPDGRYHSSPTSYNNFLGTQSTSLPYNGSDLDPQNEVFLDPFTTTNIQFSGDFTDYNTLNFDSGGTSGFGGETSSGLNAMSDQPISDSQQEYLSDWADFWAWRSYNDPNLDQAEERARYEDAQDSQDYAEYVAWRDAGKPAPKSTSSDTSNHVQLSDGWTFHNGQYYDPSGGTHSTYDAYRNRDPVTGAAPSSTGGLAGVDTGTGNPDGFNEKEFDRMMEDGWWYDTSERQWVDANGNRHDSDDAYDNRNQQTPQQDPTGPTTTTGGGDVTWNTHPSFPGYDWAYEDGKIIYRDTNTQQPANVQDVLDSVNVPTDTTGPQPAPSGDTTGPEIPPILIDPFPSENPDGTQTPGTTTSTGGGGGDSGFGIDDIISIINAIPTSSGPTTGPYSDQSGGILETILGTLGGGGGSSSSTSVATGGAGGAGGVGVGTGGSAEATIGNTTATNTINFDGLLRGLFDGGIFGGGGDSGGGGLSDLLQTAIGDYLASRSSDNNASDAKELQQQALAGSDPYFGYRTALGYPDNEGGFTGANPGNDAAMLQNLLQNPYQTTDYTPREALRYDNFSSGVPHQTAGNFSRDFNYQPFGGTTPYQAGSFSGGRYDAQGYTAGADGRLNLEGFNSPNQGSFNFEQYNNPDRFQYDDFNFQFDQSDPSYQFRVDEALRGVQRGMSSSGYNQSGNVLAALNDRASQMASTEYQAEYGRDFNDWQANKNLAYDTSRENWARDFQTADFNLQGGLAAADLNFGQDVTGFGLNQQTDLTNNLTNYQRDFSESQYNEGLRQLMDQINYGRDQGEFAINQDEQRYAQSTNFNQALQQWASNLGLAQTDYGLDFQREQYNTQQDQQVNSENYSRDLQNYLTNYATNLQFNNDQYAREQADWMNTNTFDQQNWIAQLEALLTSSGAAGGDSARGTDIMTTLGQFGADKNQEGDMILLASLLGLA